MQLSNPFYLRICREYVRLNFQSVAAQEDFGTMEVDELIYTIKLDDVVVNDEMTLFRLLVEWIKKHNVDDENLIRRVFEHVRFPMMTSTELEGLYGNYPFMGEFVTFFDERLALAKQFVECEPF